LASIANELPSAQFADMMDFVKPRILIFHPKELGFPLKQLIPEISEMVHRDLLHSERFPYLKNLVHTQLEREHESVSLKSLFMFRPFINQLPKIIPQVTNQDDVLIETNSILNGDKIEKEALVYSQFNVLNTGYFIGKSMEFAPEDRICVLLPLTKYNGLAIGFWSSIACGSNVVIPSKQPSNFESTLKAISIEKCSVLIATIEYFDALSKLASLKDYDLSSLKKVLLVGTSQNQPVSQDAVSRFGVKDIFTFNSKEGILFNRGSGKGKLLPHVEAKIVDGELKTKGYHVPKQYRTDRQNTKFVDSDGWMDSGVKMSIDSDGNFTRKQ